MSIIIADDDGDLRALVWFTLTQGGFQVRAFANGESTLAAVDSELPELLVLDINLPDCSGFDICREVRRRSPVPILMLSARNGEDDVVTALEVGADDYLTKPFSPRTLLARTRALLRRSQTTAAPSILTYGSISLDVDEHRLSIGGQQVTLTSLEARFMRLLLTNPSRTVTQSRLLEQIWGGAGQRERNALKQLVYRLRSKIEIEPANPSVLQTTPGAGYRLVPP